MQLEPQSQAVYDAKRAGGAGVADMDVAQARAMMTGLRQYHSSSVQVAATRDLEVGEHDVAVRVYVPSSLTAGLPPVVFTHGGGWVIGELEDFDPFCREVAELAGATVVSVDYRKAPEHPFPAAIDDSWEALQWAARELSDDGRVIVMGDSAGGNLAAVCARRARDAGAPQVIAQVLAYPNTDVRLDRESHRLHGEDWYITTNADLVWFRDKYLPDEASRTSPDAYPMMAEDFGGLPAAFVLLADHDPLVDEGIAYAERLRDAGVPAEVVLKEGVMHGFLTSQGALDAADEGVALVVDYLRSLVSAAPVAR